MTAAELLTGLHIAIAVVVLIVLYHALFAIVNIRKITKRAEKASEAAEELVLKPLAIVEGVLDVVQSVKGNDKKPSKKKKK